MPQAPYPIPGQQPGGYSVPQGPGGPVIINQPHPGHQAIDNGSKLCFSLHLLVATANSWHGSHAWGQLNWFPISGIIRITDKSKTIHGNQWPDSRRNDNNLFIQHWSTRVPLHITISPASQSSVFVHSFPVFVVGAACGTSEMQQFNLNDRQICASFRFSVIPWSFPYHCWRLIFSRLLICYFYFAGMRTR